MRRAVALAFASTFLPLFACAGAPPNVASAPAPSSSIASATSSSARATGAVGAFAIVDPSAILREQPSPDAAGIRGEVDEARARALRSDDSSYALFRVGEEHGDFVAIDALDDGPSGYACSDAPASLSPFAVRLWVRKDGLAKVTTRRVRTKYDDGTSVTVPAGVVLHPGDGGQSWSLRFDAPLELPLDVPDDAIGTSFVPGPGFAVDPAHAIGFVDGAFRLAGREWKGDVFGDRAAYQRRATPNGTLVTLRSMCAEYEVLASMSTDVYGVGGLDRGGRGRPGKCSIVPSGAAVFFRSGARAGQTRRPLRAPSADANGLSCFRRSLARDGKELAQKGVQSFVELCVRTSDVTEGPCAGT